MSLTGKQLEQFEISGYLLLRGALNPEDIDPVIAEYEEHIDRRVGELLVQGRIEDGHEAEGFDRRLASICRQDNEIYRELDIMHFRGRASFEFLANERLLDLVESIVGPEITCSPIQHTRPKLPAGLAPGGSDAHVAPWHQDAGVTWEEADPYFILTVWLPLASATPENGCLQIIPQTHQQGLVKHVSRPGVGTIIPEDQMPSDQPLTLPMEKGDVLFLHKQVPHRSTPNSSDTVRWSMDLRYQETGTLTGRPFHPEFVVRSRTRPETVLRDYDRWCLLWEEALQPERKPQRSAHRWEAEALDT